MKDFAKKMFDAFWNHPQIMAAAFVGGLTLGCIIILVTHPEMVHAVWGLK